MAVLKVAAMAACLLLAAIFIIPVWLQPAVVLGSALWMSLEAWSFGNDRSNVDGRKVFGPLGWFMVGMVLWVVAFPFYLVRRSALRAAGARRRTAMPTVGPPPGDHRGPDASTNPDSAATATGWEAVAEATMPRGPAPGLEYASLVRRFVAYLIDELLLIIIAIFVSSIVLAAVAPGATWGDRTLADPLATFLASVTAAAISAGYFIVSWRWRGGSTGQLMLGLIVGNAADGGRLTWRSAFVRWMALTAGGAVWIPDLSHLLNSLLALWSVVLFISAAIDKRNQGLHDRWAQSLVVRRVPVTRQENAEPAPAAVQAPRPSRTAMWTSGAALAVLLLVGAFAASSGAPPNVPPAGEIWFGDEFEAATLELNERTSSIGRDETSSIVLRLPESRDSSDLSLHLRLDGTLVESVAFSAIPGTVGESDHWGFSDPFAEAGEWTIEVTDSDANVLASGSVTVVANRHQSSRTVV